MTKSQMTLILGIITIFSPCVPCVGTPLFTLCFVGTMVLGLLAHKDAAETEEDTRLAKIGMLCAFIPVVLLVVFIFLYLVFGFGAVILSVLMGN